MLPVSVNVFKRSGKAERFYILLKLLPVFSHLSLLGAFSSHIVSQYEYTAKTFVSAKKQSFVGIYLFPITLSFIQNAHLELFLHTSACNTTFAQTPIHGLSITLIRPYQPQELNVPSITLKFQAFPTLAKVLNLTQDFVAQCFTSTKELRSQMATQCHCVV